MFEIVLFQPEIPQNTGNIGRLCVSTGSRLHLIKPLGFSLEDKFLKRAGLDYWQFLQLSVYEDWTDFSNSHDNARFFFFSTRGSRSFWECPFGENDFLIFGNEGSGLPQEFYRQYNDQLYTIPMPGKHCRSLNLANSAAIVLYEGMRRVLT